MKRFPIYIFMAVAVVAGICGYACSSGGGDSAGENAPDTLRAVTLYGPTSFFDYRGVKMGFDYENVRRFAKDEGYILDLKVAPTLNAMLDMLRRGEADLAAYPVPLIEEYRSVVRHCGYREVTWQVLVQPAGKRKISDVTDLVGQTVCVERDSKYHFRLNNLNNELGGGISVMTIDRDSLITEDLIEMVDDGEIPLTVVDSDIAGLNRPYFPKLDMEMKISLDQYSSWAVRPGCDSLASRIDRWGNRVENSEITREIYKKYFEKSKTPALYADPVTAFGLSLEKGGKISSYDGIFRRHASIPGYDWRLLASIGLNESGFNNDIVSWAGAVGLMQLMPPTAEAMGVDVAMLKSPESNILAAARLLAHLDRSLESKVPDKEERVNFVVAAYNSGLGHIYDAIALAKKYGLDPTKWLGNVSEAVLMKSRPKYYNDPVVKNGYFRGRETVEFVEKVMGVYSHFIEAGIPE